MPRSAADVQHNNFSEGFITEATGLSYPENALVDVDNCDIELNGLIRRRLGLDQEAGGFTVGNDYFKDGLSQQGNVSKDKLAITWHLWPQPANRTNLYFLVVQIGNVLITLNYKSEVLSDVSSIESLVSTNRMLSITDFNNQIPGDGFSTQMERDAFSAVTPLESTFGSGRVWFTAQSVVPFYLEYDPSTLTINKVAVGRSSEEFNSTDSKCRFRDFNGVPDGLETAERPPSLSDTHTYNLRNQGWPTLLQVAISDDDTATRDSIFSFNASADTSGYPSNADFPFAFRNSASSTPSLIGMVSFFTADETLLGNSPAAKGHFILDLLTGNRDNVATDVGPSGFNGQPIDFSNQYDETTSSGFKSCAFFSGRLWIAGDENKKRPNGIYFSQIVRKPEDAGKFYQEQDPTAEDFNALLATDGGVIYLPEAANIQKLEPYGSGLLVMAENGVWFIYGGDSGFTATEFTVERISSTGILSPKTVVRTESIVVFWAENSIHAIALPERGIVPVIQDIAATKVFSYYNNIPREARENAYGCFDSISKKVFWAFLEEDSYSYPSKQSLYNSMLILDGRTGAFTKYSFASYPDDTQYISCPIPKRTGTKPRSLENVLISTGDEVLVDTDDVVVFGMPEESDEFLNSIKVIITDGMEEALFMGEFYDVTFRDFNTIPNIPVSEFESLLITAPLTLGDFMRYKKTTYLHSFFERTEVGFEIDTSGSLVASRPSGCLVRAQWDWHDSNAGNEWGGQQKAYRYRRAYVPTGVDDNFDNGASIVYTKLKIRGRGRAVSFRYESVPNTDFRLLGFSAAMTANGV